MFDKLLPILGYPHLAAGGYTKQTPNNAGGIPDYTILPGTRTQWFLDAKRWAKKLTENDEAQVVNYANNHGSAWALLSNGLEWRVYRSNLLGASVSEKCFAKLASLWDDGAAEWLAYLSREAIEGGHLETRYRLERLKRWLKNELKNEKTKLVNHLRSRAKNELNLASVTGDEVLAAAQRVLLPGTGTQARLKPELPAPEPPADQGRAPAGAEHTIAYLAEHADLIAEKSPVALQMQGQQPTRADTWRDVALLVVKRVVHLNRLPDLPFTGQTRGYRYFLNREPKHAKGKPFRAARRAHEAEGKLIYLDVSRSAHDLCSVTTALIEAAGLNPEDFVVTLRE